MKLDMITLAVALLLAPIGALSAEPDATGSARGQVAPATAAPSLPPLERLAPAIDYANGIGPGPRATPRPAPTASPEESPILPPEDAGKDADASRREATKLVKGPAPVDGF